MQQNKGKERADKRARTNDKNNGSESDGNKQGEEGVGDDVETKVCFIFFGSLRFNTLYTKNRRTWMRLKTFAFAWNKT